MGKIALASELSTAVAMNGGVNDAGEMNMQMLEAAEKSAEYLSDKQGQPFVLVDLFSEKGTPDRQQYLAGWIGIVADIPKPVGLVKTHLVNGGIVIEGDSVEWQGAWEQGSEAGKFTTHTLGRQSGPVLPFESWALTLGVPGRITRENEKYNIRQDLVAGSDIVPWIREYFTPQAQYSTYYDIIFSVINSLPEGSDMSALDSLLVSPFVELADAELKTLLELKHSLIDYQKVVTNLQAQVAGKMGEINMVMQGIEQQLLALGRDLPRTRGSYRDSVTVAVDAPVPPSVRARLETIEYATEPLSTLVRRARDVRLAEAE